MPVPIVRGSRFRGPWIVVALGGLLSLAACADPPTETTAGPDGNPAALGPSPTTSPPVVAECPVGTTTASGALPGSGALFLICVPPDVERQSRRLRSRLREPVRSARHSGRCRGRPQISQIVTAWALPSPRPATAATASSCSMREQDLQRLVSTFQAAVRGGTGRHLAGGVSEGALSRCCGGTVPAALRRRPRGCGPVGDFPTQINHLNDFRVLFDFFFPDVIPGTAIAIPEAAIQAWLPRPRAAPSGRAGGAPGESLATVPLLRPPGSLCHRPRPRRRSRVRAPPPGVQHSRDGGRAASRTGSRTTTRDRIYPARSTTRLSGASPPTSRRSAT